MDRFENIRLKEKSNFQNVQCSMTSFMFLKNQYVYIVNGYRCEVNVYLVDFI